MGAGVDHIVNDPNLPNGVPITRIVSDALSAPMSNYCIGAILHYQRQFDQYVRDKVQKRWHQEFNPEREMNVGIMGLGKLGQDLALKLLPLGFNVCGLSQSRKQIEGVKSFVMDEIDNFLSSVNILVVMLPATPETKGILSMPLFNKMRRGTFLINVARGFHQVDDDILTALDRGILDGAFLDVFPEEPLPQSSALWDHPKVMITPHIAVVTKVEAAVPQIVEAHRLVLAGKLPKIVVDLEKGY
jgi:glyoxylate/hydroxypyruvate reductase A